MAQFSFNSSFAAASLCVFLASGAGQAKDGSVPEQQPSVQLEKTIAKVRKGESITARTNAAQHLAELTRDIDPQRVDDDTFSDMVGLLDSNEDSVRAWVAASLGNLGPRAKLAVPKLLALLPEADCLRGSLTSSPVIRMALTKIGVTPPATKCRDSAGHPYPPKR